jgi:hypothetical protein
MSDSAKAFGVGASIEWKGIRYAMAAFTYKMASMFSAWLEEEAWAKVERSRGRVSDEVYQARHRAMSELIGSGVYEVGQVAYAQKFASSEGQKMQLYLMLSKEDPKFPMSILEEMYAEKFTELMARKEELNDDPLAAGSAGPETAQPAAAEAQAAEAPPS